MKEPKSIRIVFFGTPEFAAMQLEFLIQQGYCMVGAVTVPDKPAGRGKKISASHVKQTALKHGIPLLQPEKLKDTNFLLQLDALKADLFIVIAFRMLPKEVWTKPVLGTFNLHASLLPQYRGAAPINRAIMNGETTTGLTTFLINESIDTGHILLQERLPIGNDETAGQLHERMIDLGKKLVEKTIIALATGDTTPIPQNVITKELLAAPKIFRNDCIIDWTKQGSQIHNQIRGLSPYPSAYTTLQNDRNDKLEIKIIRGKFEARESKSDKESFSLLTDNRSFLKVALPDGYYHIHVIQISGKKAMETAEFLRGNKFEGSWKIS